MRPTKEGKKFLLAIALIAVAAVNTGNNLIYLVLSLMLSIIVISVVGLRLNLRSLSLEASIEGPVFAKEEAILKLALTNKKRFLPSYSLRVELPPGMKGKGFIPYARSSATTEGGVKALFEKRGVYRLENLFVESGFPFIFFTRRLRIRAKGEVVVYPEVKEIDISSALSAGDYREHARRPGDGDEMLFIREFRYGDDLKRINWKATAKADKLMVKEFAMDEPKSLTIILDSIVGGARGANSAGARGAEVFEKAVSFAASASVKFIKEGFFVRLLTCKDTQAFGSGPEHLRRLLYSLALVKEHDTWECPNIAGATCPDIAGARSPGGTLLILKSGDSALRRLSPDCDMVVYASSL